jgi:hypothetical protein
LSETSAENVGTTLKKYWVSFFNPVTKLKHSSWAVAAANPVQAVKQAIDRAQTEMRGTELAHIATYDTAIRDENGNPIPGISKVMSKAQLVAQMQELQKQLGLLDDSGETTSQSQAVAATLGTIPRTVAPPVTSASALSHPTVFVPPPSEPKSQEVDPASAPKLNTGALTQAQVDQMIAEAQAKVGQQ